MAADLLVLNADVATLRADAGPYGLVPRGAVAVRGDRIAWVGPAAELPETLRGPETAVLDGAGGCVTPGLVDCHTHAVFAGTRVREFEARLGGATYEELARAGGGILSSVRATRAATLDELVASATRRVEDLLAEGVTGVEIKSGYGLDVDTELRMLEAARRVGERLGVPVSATLLGAHALPEEFACDRTGYVDLVCREMIPRAAAAGLADCVDAFCEEIAFTPGECARVFEAAAAHGLPVRLHADQRTDGGGAAVAARHRARSADHLEHTGPEGVAAMAAAGTSAVLLPGAAHFLADPTVPPVAAFREAGVPMAVATDLNPGSSPLRSPLMAMNLACARFGLTPEESLAGMTREGARALGWAGECGRLEEGLRGDLALWEVHHPAELSYWMGGNPCRAVVAGGRLRAGGTPA